MKYLQLAMWVLISCFFATCDDPISPNNGNGNGGNVPDLSVETIIPTGEEAYLNTDSDYIFDQSAFHTFELTLPDAALDILDANPAAEEYVEGSLTFQGETLSPVGIRYKGSIGAFVGCVSGNDWSNPSGEKTCTKLSMKVKINWNGSDAKFYGLKKLQFHSMNQDDAQMRERIGYHLFRTMGVPAPRSVHVRLLINGAFSGVYALTEQIDGRFTRYNFEHGKGNLYKEIWPLKSNHQTYANSTYLEHLKTNEDETLVAEMIRNFGEEIIAAEGQEELQTVVSNWMNISEIMSYIAVDRTIRNDDGAFHWYCDGNTCTNHNYYWYEEPTENILHLIPWDLDNAFENIIANLNPVTPIADDWGETSNNCNPFSSGIFGITQRSAACDKLTSAWVSFEEEYEEKVTYFKENKLAADEVNALIDTWSEQIRAATQEAKETHGDAISVSQWENAVTKLKTQLEYARTH